jgi:dodecin
MRGTAIPRAAACDQENPLAVAPLVDRLRQRGRLQEGTTMAVVKVIELLAESEQSWEDAARQAVVEATKTVRGVSSVYISEFQATVENDKVKNFRINCKVSFVLDKS